MVLLGLRPGVAVISGIEEFFYFFFILGTEQLTTFTTTEISYKEKGKVRKRNR